MNVSGSSKALGQTGSNTKYIKIALLVTFAFLVCCSYVVFKGFQTKKWPPPIPQEFENLEPAAGQKTQQKVLLAFILLCFVIAFGIVFVHMMSR